MFTLCQKGKKSCIWRGRNFCCCVLKKKTCETENPKYLIKEQKAVVLFTTTVSTTQGNLNILWKIKKKCDLYKWRSTFSSCSSSQFWGAIGFSIVEIYSPVYFGHLETVLAKIGQVSEICQPFENTHSFIIFLKFGKINKSL